MIRVRALKLGIQTGVRGSLARRLEISGTLHKLPTVRRNPHETSWITSGQTWSVHVSYDGGLPREPEGLGSLTRPFH